MADILPGYCAFDAAARADAVRRFLGADRPDIIELAPLTRRDGRANR